MPEMPRNAYHKAYSRLNSVSAILKVKIFFSNVWMVFVLTGFADVKMVDIDECIVLHILYVITFKLIAQNGTSIES